MFNLGGGEILVILLLALIVLGPERLPEAARKLGTAIGEVRRMASGFQNEIKAALDDAELTTGSKPTTATPTTSKARPVTEPTPLPAERSPNGGTPSSIGPATPGASHDGAGGRAGRTGRGDAGRHGRHRGRRGGRQRRAGRRLGPGRP